MFKNNKQCSERMNREAAASSEVMGEVGGGLC